MHLHYIKTFFVPKQTAKTCHILVIVCDQILKKKKNEVANCDDCIEIFLLHFLQFARKMSNPLHKAVSVDRLIGWEAFLELDP